MNLVKYILVGLLLITGYHAMGVSVGLTAVNSRVGDDVTLPCNNVIHSNCSSTTWLYAQSIHQELVQLVNNSHRNEKITMGSDCSLHIHKVSTEDAGSYTCRQIIHGTQRGADAVVYLSLLTVVPLNDLMPGSNMTLQCLLYTYGGPGQCNKQPFNSLTLRWVNDTGTDLQGDPRYQIHASSCDSTLTTELQWTDNNRKWKCQLADKGEVKVSQSYSSTFPDRSPTTAGIVSGVAVFGAVCVAVVVMVIIKRRAGNQKETSHSKTCDSETYATIDYLTTQQAEKGKLETYIFSEYATITEHTLKH
ncbi:uncharacterized protein LOC125715055 isoform X4 [Brienomyrus brachyistius]|uniref:uncharacterized protein LOC125715055 isoform X4 n=1 Tax=Brienomyrus brachyistius TaxID=42636 RepID=UPI0020B3F1CC|nr:uncharacterized protein LOC125715055 isoform X4 [Brienomyrus brachyistius]